MGGLILRYVLNAFITDKNIFLDITKEEFESIRKAKESYFDLLKIEEIYFNLLKNYKEFEMAMFEKAIDSVIFRDYTWDTFKEKIHEFDRRIFNFLAQVRLFFDHTSRILGNVYGKESKELAYFEKLRNSKYDDSFSFRLLEAVRNYSQHSDLPVGSINMMFKNVNIDGEDKKTAYTTPFLNVMKIKSDKKFKSSVREEINDDDKIDLSFHLRSYISDLSSIHYMMNKYQEEYIKGIINKLYGLRNYYKEYTFEELPWIEAIGDEGDDNVLISYETLERYSFLNLRSSTFHRFEEMVIII